VIKTVNGAGSEIVVKRGGGDDWVERGVREKRAGRWRRVKIVENNKNRRAREEEKERGRQRMGWKEVEGDGKWGTFAVF